jgi:hypothetical protein
MIARTGWPHIRHIQRSIPEIGLLLGPGTNWMHPCGMSYACDNGVYAAWMKGRNWDQGMHDAYIHMLNRLPMGNNPLWVLLPDAVADWERTVELAKEYSPYLRRRALQVAIALQDGCDFNEALQFAPDCVFVAGSTEWKLQNILPACNFFKPMEISVHVGRVNSVERLCYCMRCGADSSDGTTLNKYVNTNLPRISNTLRWIFR